MMQRRLCAAILLLQSIVVGLSSAVMATVEDIDTALALGLGLGLAALCLLTAGLLRFSWGYHLGWVVQAGTLALGLVAPAMIALGVVFLALWITAFRLGRMIDRDRAAAAPPH